MSNIEKIKRIVLKDIKEYKEKSTDHYDFWNEHVKYVYEESIKLAEKYNADVEIVKLGALLHDIALIRKVGDRKGHHENGAVIAKKILKELKYSNEVINRVVDCVYNHRSSKNAKTIEEICVCDADILAHFDNIPMLFNSLFVRCNVSLNDARDAIKVAFEKDYNDLSEQTKLDFKEQYDNICKVVIGD